MRKTYHLHGLGRHTLDEQKSFARRDLQAIATQTSNNGYIAGDRLTVYDFAVASLVAGMIDNEPSTWISTLAMETPAVGEYAERIQSEINVYCRK